MLNPSSLPLAEFSNPEDFDHFENPEHPKCFACNSKRMLIRPRLVTDAYTLIDATMKVGDHFRVMLGVYLIFPRLHVESFMDMPRDWQGSIQDAIAFLERDGVLVDNTSANLSKRGGQTVPHGHTWLIDRSMLKEKGLMSENTGFATLMYRVVQYGVVLPG